MNRIARSSFAAIPLLVAVAVASACSTGIGAAGSIAPRQTSEPTDVAASPDATSAASASTPAQSSRPTGAGSTAKPTPAQTPTQTPTGKMALKVYFLDYQSSDDSPPVIVAVNRTLDRTQAVATAATRALLAGPTNQERAHDLRVGTLGTDVPGRTVLLGITIQNGLATVDLSSEFESAGPRGVAQVVYTLTQFSTVDRVNFRLDGQPIKAIDGQRRTLNRPATRADYMNLLPAIFVDQPSWGSNVSGTIRVSGKANVFEAQFMAALVAWSPEGDRILVQRSVMATCGTGCWGDFETTLTAPTSLASNTELHLRVWEPSARDGSPTNVLEYPLR
jgi:spore germination protein GerM